MNKQILSEIVSLEGFVFDDSNIGDVVFDKAIELYEKKEAVKEFIASAIEQSGEGFYVNAQNGKCLVLSPSAKELGKWQATVLFENRPICDCGTKELRDSIEYMFNEICFSELSDGELSKFEVFLS